MMKPLTDNRGFANQYLQNLLQGNRSECSAIAQKYLTETPSIKKLYEEVFREALYEVGQLWENNKISVATEHLATAITEGILNELYSKMTTGASVDKKVVLTTAEHEDHQVGIKMVADIFEMQGWKTYYLGTGIPAEELIRFIKEIRADMLAVSLSVYFNFSSLLQLLEKIEEAFPELPILVGGQALLRSAEDLSERFRNVKYISDLHLLDDYIASIT
jgi:MerR family transcriptional regulator, light-induced transcriptional regulator